MRTRRCRSNRPSRTPNVSLGYLSEIERGHKEASSELLASICDALGAPLSSMLTDVSATFALAEQMEDAFTSAVSEHAATRTEAVTEGDVTVQVHSTGPLRTTLITKRVPPGQRFNESALVG